jgi:phytoene desaturase
MSGNYDAIIVGSGVGGMVCGAKLAKRGLKVLIAERHDRPGGCVTSCRKRGFNFDYGAHIFGSCNRGGLLQHYLNELGVKCDGFVRLDPTERFVFPDAVVDVPQDMREYAEALKERFPKEAGGIGPFFDDAMRIARNFSSDSLLSRFKRLSYERFLRRYFSDERLMCILSGQFWYLGVPPKRLSATYMCLMMMSYLRDGTYYPRGGPQSFSDALAARFKELGGTLALGAEVKRIAVRGGRVLGVETGDGREHRSGIVVSNADAIRTFTKLIDGDEIGCGYLDRIRRMKVGSSFLLGFFGVKDSMDCAAKRGWYHSSSRIGSGFGDTLYVFVPSLVDRSAAPAGHNVVEAALPFSYDRDRAEGRRAFKEELREKLLDALERVMPGIRGSIVYDEIATPRTIERYTYNARGSMFGWETRASQMHDGRLGHETPIEGLYLTGHWTTPGCGVTSVATSGWMVAEAVAGRARGRLSVAAAGR